MTDETAAEVTFASTVSAREMRFVEVPDTRVDFTGSPAHQSESGSDRVHLPNAVSAGVTYRDVRVDYRIEAHVLVEPTTDASPGEHAHGVACRWV